MGHEFRESNALGAGKENLNEQVSTAFAQEAFSCAQTDTTNAQTGNENGPQAQGTDRALGEAVGQVTDAVVAAKGFGDVAQQQRIRTQFQNRAGDLQSFIDAINRKFETDGKPYYTGLGRNNTIILYTPSGIQTLDLNGR